MIRDDRSAVLKRHAVHVSGQGARSIIFAHGFGCDQNVWKDVAPAFEADHQVVLFDHVGAGASDLSAFDKKRHSSLGGYATDVLEICEALELRDAIFVGHSVSAMIGVLAAIKNPSVFSHLILVGPSPCYINDGAYRGGFDTTELNELLDFMDSNFLGWSEAIAPQVMGNADHPDLGVGLTRSFCATDPDIAKHFGRVTFLSDNRDDLPKVTTPSLIMQCSDDILAPDQVGAYIHERMPDSTFVQLKATGHCPNVSHPAEVTSSMRRYLKGVGVTETAYA